MKVCEDWLLQNEIAKAHRKIMAKSRNERKRTSDSGNGKKKKKSRAMTRRR